MHLQYKIKRAWGGRHSLGMVWVGPARLPLDPSEVTVAHYEPEWILHVVLAPARRTNFKAAAVSDSPWAYHKVLRLQDACTPVLLCAVALQLSNRETFQCFQADELTHVLVRSSCEAGF